MIPAQLKQELEQRVAQAITPREAAVDVMKELQRHYGWLTDEAVAEAALLLGLSAPWDGRWSMCATPSPAGPWGAKPS